MGFPSDRVIYPYLASIQGLARHNAAGLFGILEVFERDESKASRDPTWSPDYLHIANSSVASKLVLQILFIRTLTHSKHAQYFRWERIVPVDPVSR